MSVGLDSQALAFLRDKLAQPFEVKEGQAHAVPDGWAMVMPDPPQPASIVGTTLGAVRDYLKANPEGLELAKMIVHVVDPTEVRVFSVVQPGERQRRWNYFRSQFIERQAIAFGQWYDAESFIIALQCGFETTTQQSSLLAFVSSIQENAVRESTDDRFTQQVSTKAGVTLVAAADIPNPVELAPWRTFTEVGQVPSPFVLRARKGAAGADRPQLALFEADGGAWKPKAMGLIREWLSRELPEGPTLIA